MSHILLVSKSPQRPLHSSVLLLRWLLELEIVTQEKGLIQRDPSEGNAHVRLWALHIPPGQVQS